MITKVKNNNHGARGKLIEQAEGVWGADLQGFGVNTGGGSQTHAPAKFGRGGTPWFSSNLVWLPAGSGGQEILFARADLVANKTIDNLVRQVRSRINKNTFSKLI